MCCAPPPLYVCVMMYICAYLPSVQTPVTGTPPSLNTSGGVTGGVVGGGGGGGGGMSLFQGLNVAPPVLASPQTQQEEVAGKTTTFTTGPLGA